MSNIVYVATSLDGYIAGPDGALDWLEIVPNPERDDLGFGAFIERVDAVVMGRLTFETVLGFGVGWPYPVPGIVLSSTLTEPPAGFEELVVVTSGSPSAVVAFARRRGYQDLYIDGGKTVQRFLTADLIDELIVTEVPILLGGGERLFGPAAERRLFELVGTEVLLGQMVKRHYRRKRSA